MHNDESTKVEKQIRPLVPEERGDEGGTAFARWWAAVAQATANGAAERREEA